MEFLTFKLLLISKTKNKNMLALGTLLCLLISPSFLDQHLNIVGSLYFKHNLLFSNIIELVPETQNMASKTEANYDRNTEKSQHYRMEGS